MTEGQHNPYAVLLRVVAAVERLSVSTSLEREITSEERAHIVQITNKIGPGSIIGSISQSTLEVGEIANMGDQYDISGQAGAVGPQAHAHDMTFNQIWNQMASDYDLGALKEELGKLRAALKANASEPEHDLAVAQVASAEMAAGSGDGPGALSHLAKVGKWALGIATTIGTTVAAAAIKSAMGV